MIYKFTRSLGIESVSGEVSTLKYTTNLRKIILEIIQEYQIKEIFDAPCGDFNWMSRVIHGTQCNYIGMDIVDELIESNKFKYSSQKINFVTGDVTKDEFPIADLLICRDLLFHFSYDDARSLINNFCNSEINYLLINHHLGNFINEDIFSGSFKLINLYTKPYNFPPPLVSFVETLPHEKFQKEICLYSREQLQNSNFLNRY